MSNPFSTKTRIIILATASVAVAGVAYAARNQVSIKKSSQQICIKTNGIPNHSIGKFPNKGNPHSIKTQNKKYCFSANPKKSSSAKKQRGAVGVGLNGVAIRPGTADYYDAGSRRGFSRNRRSGWNLEGIGPKNILGMDRNNAHVDERGLYHYHGKPTGLLAKVSGSHIGYAADGFEIHYVGTKAKSGWKLKSGTRPSAPGGKYDGTYVQDYSYVGGSGKLDKCNGGTLNGKFVYFATTTYPFYPRCLWGSANRSFSNR